MIAGPIPMALAELPAAQRKSAPWPETAKGPETAKAEAPEPSQIAREEDLGLIRTVLEGEGEAAEDAFTSLVQRYKHRAYWIAFHVVGRVEEARDVTQEAFLRVYKSLHRFDFKRSFYAWFHRIVTNLAIDSLRKIKASRSRLVEEIEPLMPLGENALEPLEQKETRALVWQVLDQLDVKFRSVMVLRDIHGMGCQEIAPILDVTHATVRWRLHRGRQIFKEHWQRMSKTWEN